MRGRDPDPSHPIDRRGALARMGGGLLAPSLLLAACGTEPGRAGAGEEGSVLGPLPPVMLDPSRVRGGYVGLRPYRPSGFRLEMERVGDTRVVHNYGHGGGGFTLSWGTATMAADLLRADGVAAETPAAVVGCGVIGLSTALVLLERGTRVTIYTQDLPLNTTSRMAAASFYPSSVSDPSGETVTFLDRIEQACRISHGRFLERLPRARYGVRWRRQFFLSDAEEADATEGPAIYQRILDLYPNGGAYEPGRHPFQAGEVFVEDNLFIEPVPYLTALLEDVRRAGGRIVTRAVQGSEGLRALPESVVMNCTGLGAQDVVEDQDPSPRGLTGQHLYMEPQPEVDYAVATDRRGAPYMFPRSDAVVLGLGEGEVVTPEEMLARQRILLPGAGA